MKLISWDIGINNLAFCLLEYNSKNIDDINILYWDKLDILDTLNVEPKKCIGLKKNGDICGKNAKYYFGEDYYCKTHKLKDKECYELKENEICCGKNKNGKKCQKIAQYFVIDNEKKIYYCETHKMQTELELQKYITRKNITFNERSILLIEKLKQIPYILEVDKVLIENQPVHKNPVMKSIQMIIYTYYLLNEKKDIYLINATQKLKIYDGPKIECTIKNKHDKNKYLGKKYCEYFLKEKDKEYYEKHNKKDDLADTFLQSLYFIKNLS